MRFTLMMPTIDSPFQITIKSNENFLYAYTFRAYEQLRALNFPKIDDFLSSFQYIVKRWNIK